MPSVSQWHWVIHWSQKLCIMYRHVGSFLHSLSQTTNKQPHFLSRVVFSFMPFASVYNPWGGYLYDFLPVRTCLYWKILPAKVLLVYCCQHSYFGRACPHLAAFASAVCPHSTRLYQHKMCCASVHQNHQLSHNLVGNFCSVLRDTTTLVRDCENLTPDSLNSLCSIP